MPNAVERVKIQLPDTLEDLSRFVLFTEERIKSMRAEIRAIQKLNVAKEIELQKRRELQDVADAMIDAQVVIGRLTKLIPKSTPKSLSPTSGLNKTETIQGIGLTKQRVSEYERMADHPEAVELAKSNARESDEPVTKETVIGIIRRNSEKIIELPQARNDIEIENLRGQIKADQVITPLYTVISKALSLLGTEARQITPRLFLCSM